MKSNFGLKTVTRTNFKLLMTTAAAALAVSLSVGSVGATTLTGNLTADNGFNAYISTSDGTLGTPIGSGADWTTTYSLTSTILTSGVTNYLHIDATNSGGPDGFIGDFALSDANFQFGNGSQSILTDTGFWTASAGSGTWFAPSGTPQSYGTNGVSPWGTKSGISASAEWIWSNPDNGTEAFLSIPINYVGSPLSATPIPAALPLFASGLGGLGLLGWRRKRKATALPA